MVASRGASGIDGILHTAIGASVGWADADATTPLLQPRRRTTLIIGDLAALHVRHDIAPAPRSIPGVQNLWSGPSLHPHLLRSGAASYLAVARIDATCPPQDLSALALAAQIDPPLTAVLLNNGGAPSNLIVACCCFTRGTLLDSLPCCSITAVSHPCSASCSSPLLLLFYTWHTTLCLISLRRPRVRWRHLPHAADRHVHRNVQSILRHATLAHTRRRAARSIFR